MDAANLFKDLTMQELFDSLDIIEKHQTAENKICYREITESQKKLYERLNIDPPS
jgi:hypothetical protein